MQGYPERGSIIELNENAQIPDNLQLPTWAVFLYELPDKDAFMAMDQLGYRYEITKAQLDAYYHPFEKRQTAG